MLIPFPSAAADVTVEGGPCARAVHVKAEGAPLQEVLSALAAKLQFKVSLEAPLDEPVTVDRKGPPETVLKDLLRDQNLVLDTKAAKACGNREIVSAIWVLPAGESTPEQAKPWNPLLAGERHPSFARRKHNYTPEEWHQLKKDWKEGRIRRDPETGAPVPVEETK